MVFSLTRLILAVLVAVIVGLVLSALLGPILITLNVPIAETLGRFLREWGFVLGVICGIWYYLTGSTPA